MSAILNVLAGAGVLATAAAAPAGVKYWADAPAGLFHDRSNWSDSFGGPGGAGAPLAGFALRRLALASFAEQLEA